MLVAPADSLRNWSGLVVQVTAIGQLYCAHTDVPVTSGGVAKKYFALGLGFFRRNFWSRLDKLLVLLSRCPQPALFLSEHSSTRFEWRLRLGFGFLSRSAFRERLEDHFEVFGMGVVAERKELEMPIDLSACRW